MLNFEIKCKKCGSNDVGITATENDHNHIDIYVYCRECKNSENAIFTH